MISNYSSTDARDCHLGWHIDIVLNNMLQQLNFKTASAIATSIVHSKLDYCNSITTFQTINLTGSNRSRTLLLMLLLRLLNPHISPPFSNLHWLKVNERIEYKLFSLTYKVLTTSQPSYLNNLISVQPPRSTRSSSVVTLSRPPTIPH